MEGGFRLQDDSRPEGDMSTVTRGRGAVEEGGGGVLVAHVIGAVFWQHLLSSGGSRV